MLINPDRLKANFDALARIGATPEGGVHRPSLSEAHLEARSWFRERALEAGLEFRVDGAGNHSAMLACGPEGAPSFLLGSHLDSVPDGGRFDGALGVVAALEALLAVQEAGIKLPVHLEAIDFTDEEGTLVGLLGSAALAGRLHPEDLAQPRGGRAALLEGFKRAGLSEESALAARRSPESLAGYLELHIEQGPRLVQERVDIGIVSAIVGITSYRLTFSGRADHAGTTPMLDRLDAAQGAAALILAARQILLDQFPGCVANVGWLELSPGAFNIVPAQASLGLEFRAGEVTTLTRLEEALLSQARQEAGRFGLSLELQLLGSHPPAPMDGALQGSIRHAAESFSLSWMSLTSGAGHDAQSLAGLCPAGMLFIPSQGGASHSPREFSAWQDCLNGANVLLNAALNFILSQGS